MAYFAAVALLMGASCVAATLRAPPLDISAAGASFKTLPDIKLAQPDSFYENATIADATRLYLKSVYPHAASIDALGALDLLWGDADLVCALRPRVGHESLSGLRIVPLHQRRERLGIAR